jgi:hypothetical protein
MENLPDVSPAADDSWLRLEALRLASSLGYTSEDFVLEAARYYLAFLKGA